MELAKEDGILDMEMEGDLRHRQRVTSRLHSPYFSQLLWDRVKDHIPQEILVTQENFVQQQGLFASPDNPHEFIGRWKPGGVVVPRVNVAHCVGKGHLAAHRDADQVLNEHEGVS